MAKARSPGEDKRSPERIEAERMYKESGGSIKLVDIAEKLVVPAAKIRKWKSLDDWEGKKKPVERSTTKPPTSKPKSPPKRVERTTKEKAPDKPKKRMGPPVGNQNAKGNKGGAPKGSRNASKLGIFSDLMTSILPEDERQIFQEDPTDKVLEEMTQELKLLNAKEYRLHKRIALVQNMIPEGGNILTARTQEVKENVKGTFKTDPKTGVPVKDEGSGFFDGEREETVIKADLSVFAALKSLEDALDKVQRQKIKLLKDIEDIKVQRERLELERKRLSGESDGSKMANAWVAALTNLGGGGKP